MSHQQKLFSNLKIDGLIENIKVKLNEGFLKIEIEPKWSRELQQLVTNIEHLYYVFLFKN